MRLVGLASSDCACVWTLTDGVPDPTANGRSSVKLSVDVDVLQLLQTIKLFSLTSSVGMPLSMAQEYVPNSAPLLFPGKCNNNNINLLLLYSVRIRKNLRLASGIRSGTRTREHDHTPVREFSRREITHVQAQFSEVCDCRKGQEICRRSSSFCLPPEANERITDTAGTSERLQQEDRAACFQDRIGNPEALRRPPGSLLQNSRN